jgi:transposase
LEIKPFIARRRTGHGSGLGTIRWVVELTIRWLKVLRGLRCRYDRMGVMQETWSALAAVICCCIACHDCI